MSLHVCHFTEKIRLEIYVTVFIVLLLEDSHSTLRSLYKTDHTWHVITEHRANYFGWDTPSMITMKRNTFVTELVI